MLKLIQNIWLILFDDEVDYASFEKMIFFKESDHSSFIKQVLTVYINFTDTSDRHQSYWAGKNRIIIRKR